MVNIIDNNGILETPANVKFNIDPRGYGAYCFYKMREFATEIAQIDVKSNKSETYGDIMIKSIRVALYMKDMGIGDTDIISLCTDPHLETCIPFWAAMFSGVKPANLDPSFSLTDLKHLVNLVKPKLIFCVPQSVNNLEIVIKELNLNTKLVVFGDTSKHLLFKDLVKPHNAENDFTPKIVEDIFNMGCIFFSSGTTGLPKAVSLSHYGMLHAIHMFKELFSFETVLYYTSPYWVTNILIISSTLLTGGKRILPQKFEPCEILKLIHNFEITFLFLAPTLLYMLVQSENSNHTYNTSSLKSMMISGGFIAQDKMEQLHNILPHTFLNNCYGLTDISGIFSGFHPQTNSKTRQDKINSVGQMMPGIICKVVNITNNEVQGKNKPGELLIKSKQTMKGFYMDPKNTSEAFDKDGFLHTGDIVYYDDEYYFYVADRIKEMFKYKSWHIQPTELEHILLKHPDVQEALVIGYPHEKDGDHPMAVIIPKQGVNITETEILNYFNEKVSDSKQLRAGVRFVKTLPKTITGKYSRMKLRNMVINNEL